MSRIITTTSPLVAARGINNGNNLSIRIRDTRSGRFMAWEGARASNFGLNGTMPVTYNHFDKTVTIRSDMSLDGFLSIKNRCHHNPLFLIDKRVIIDSTYDEDEDDWPRWNRWTFSHQRYVFELYL